MIHPALRYPIAAFYAYGALVHLANMAGLNGFHWPEAPLKWQLLDLAYLALDIVVVAGLLRASRIGLAALVVAASSQILLYTLLRGWVLDVPPAFAPTAEAIAYLDVLVGFHVVCLALLALSPALGRRSRAEAPSRAEVKRGDARVPRVRIGSSRHSRTRALRAHLAVALLVATGGAVVPSDRAAAGDTAEPLTGIYASPDLAMLVRFGPCDGDGELTCGRLVGSWHDDDPVLRAEMGRTVVGDLKRDGDQWKGTLRDPSNDRVYRGSLTRLDADTLRLKGCAAIFCSSQTWRSLRSIAAMIEALR